MQQVKCDSTWKKYAVSNLEGKFLQCHRRTEGLRHEIAIGKTGNIHAQVCSFCTSIHTENMNQNKTSPDDPWDEKNLSLPLMSPYKPNGLTHVPYCAFWTSLMYDTVNFDTVKFVY